MVVFLLSLVVVFAFFFFFFAVVGGVGGGCFVFSLSMFKALKLQPGGSCTSTSLNCSLLFITL